MVADVHAIYEVQVFLEIRKGENERMASRRDFDGRRLVPVPRVGRLEDDAEKECVLFRIVDVEDDVFRAAEIPPVIHEIRSDVVGIGRGFFEAAFEGMPSIRKPGAGNPGGRRKFFGPPLLPVECGPNPVVPLLEIVERLDRSAGNFRLVADDVLRGCGQRRQKKCENRK